jgi:ribosomal protein L7/L12
LTKTQVTQLQTALMQRNRVLATGHFSLDNGVYFECSIPLRDAELTQLQVEHLLRVAVAEIRHFHHFLDELKASPVGESESTLGDMLTTIRNALKKPETREETEGSDTGEAQTLPSMTELSPEASGNHVACQVVLTAMETASKLEVVKLIKKHRRGLSLLQVKKLVESAPTPIGDWASRTEAEVVVQELMECGARAVII